MDRNWDLWYEQEAGQGAGRGPGGPPYCLSRSGRDVLGYGARFGERCSVFTQALEVKPDCAGHQFCSLG